MTSVIQIAQMSREEQLQTMEALWGDLSKDDVNIVSPAWHAEVLRETSARIASGQEPVTDWTTAKRELRKRFE
jgi:hypothetical protein